MPHGCVYVGRPSIYGSPFLIERDTTFDQSWVVFWSDVGPVHSRHETQREARVAAVSLYAEWVAAEVIDPMVWPSQLATAAQHVFLKSALAQGLLRGKDVACWCPLDHACHGDVLLGLSAA